MRFLICALIYTHAKALFKSIESAKILIKQVYTSQQWNAFGCSLRFLFPDTKPLYNSIFVTNTQTRAISLRLMTILCILLATERPCAIVKGAWENALFPSRRHLIQLYYYTLCLHTHSHTNLEYIASKCVPSYISIAKYLCW